MKRLLLVACLILATASISYAQTTQRVTTATIAASGSLSTAVRLEAGTLTAIKVPVLTAANFTVLVSTDGVTYTQLYDEFNNLVTITTGDGTAARWIRLSPGDWWSWKWIKFQSGTVAVPVVQAAARTITVVYK